MHALYNAFGDFPSQISPFVSRPSVVEFNDSWLFVEYPADGLLAQSPELRYFIDGIVLLECTIRHVGLVYLNRLHKQNLFSLLR